MMLPAEPVKAMDKFADTVRETDERPETVRGRDVLAGGPHARPFGDDRR